MVSRAGRTDVVGVSVPTGLFVGGVWRRAAGAFTVDDPATMHPLAEVADGSVTDALAALDAAHAAQDAWGRTAPRERAEVLRRAFDEVVRRTDDFAAVITAEMGKPLAEARGEVAYGAEFLRWFAEQTAHVHGDFGTAPSGAFHVLTTKRPVGPSYLVIPWNFPLAMGTRKIGAALAAGCTVVLKPAAQTPLTSALLVEVLEAAGVPAGVVNLVPTTDAAAQSAALMADPRLRKVSFTGSTGAGRTLLRQAADQVLRTSMELGGNSPFIVLEDADVDAAVEGAMLAKFRNGGESCVAANRFIVHAAVAEEFTARFVERVEALVPGPGADPTTTIGPLIDARSVEKVDALVQAAVSDGAVVRAGGSRVEGAGYFYRPTVLTDVAPGSRISGEEVFGPVAPITVVGSEDEAVALANATQYGLAAFVYTRDVARALDLGTRIEAGMIGVNRGLVSEAGAPFGGVKQSGLGREGGHVGIEEYLETVYLAVDRS
ncbi:NAD-dependent succinate-semialdehyde dehydrogenase [Curtobacterium sp. MCBA15_001]|uniref:NAD-dependent succinate-semialdehyde dehydrogenase n=1 Tax=Curtobacterium sp. MCBA15_001 TaxID=1898731 RepID=UPI0008DE0529|nr:NAD-dependent succinate-semialdehyde dehydrogenase [Curtobacterium sp. MCBA15_001]OIH98162.1 NAD-dependent succinate-semialdehyde dehydrogenase [Curtobacterium sp. MCBA15_001]